MRILVIGNEGSGKSVLAARMSKDLDLPVMHLDLFAWTKNFRKVPEPVFRQKLAEQMKERKMIIEGWTLQSTMRERIEWANAIIYLCYSTEFCLRSVSDRSVEFNNRDYPYDSFEGDRLAQVGFYTEMIARIHDEYEPEVQVWLKEMEDKKMTYTYYSRDDLEACYDQMIKKFRKTTGRSR